MDSGYLFDGEKVNEIKKSLINGCKVTMTSYTVESNF